MKKLVLLDLVTLVLVIEKLQLEGILERGNQFKFQHLKDQNLL